MSARLPIEPLEVLFEAASLPVDELPPPLEEAYGGSFGLAEPRVYTNFVATIDGVVAVPSLPRSNALIGAGSDADRFVMGLLRAFADCVLIGAGTLRSSPKGTWLAESVFPPAGEEFARLRVARRRPPMPQIAILTGHGSIDSEHPILRSGALVLTTDEAAERLIDVLPDEATLISLGSHEQLDTHLVLATLRERGHSLILSEAGPHTFGGLLEARAVDELFLTVSPLLAGGRGDDDVYGLVESVTLLPPGVRAQLASIRRHGEHLFLRYAVDHTPPKESE